MKPSVFFSHSSLDKSSLVRLKDLFCQKTGGSIDVFLSSDGQSIPLGRNWVHRVQGALEETKLMLVFITANALRSSWIYFESGFAYSKGIKVVPVGFLGADVSLLAPPLNLLQGFNITSADGLDNLIALVNQEFSHQHTAHFTSDEFQELISKSSAGGMQSLGQYDRLFDEVRINLPPKSMLACDVPAVIDRVKQVLSANNVEFTENEWKVQAFGMSLEIRGGVSHPQSCQFYLDPSMLAVTLPILNEILKRIATNGVAGVEMSFNFDEGVGILTDCHKITARLFGSGVKLDSTDKFQYGEILFVCGENHYTSGEKRAYLRLTLLNDRSTIESLRELVDLLFERQVIYIEVGN